MFSSDEKKLAAGRLFAWIRGFSHLKQPVFIADLKTVLSAYEGLTLPYDESQWVRLPNVSSWSGPDLSLLCVEHPMLECWHWTCFGWRIPGDAQEAKDGWVWSPSREQAEKAALQFYLQKDD